MQSVCRTWSAHLPIVSSKKKRAEPQSDGKNIGNKNSWGSECRQRARLKSEIFSAMPFPPKAPKFPHPDHWPDKRQWRLHAVIGILYHLVMFCPPPQKKTLFFFGCFFSPAVADNNQKINENHPGFWASSSPWAKELKRSRS